jgi:hypothetical protein
MYQPPPGTAWMPANFELGWPGVVHRRAGEPRRPW